MQRKARTVDVAVYCAAALALSSVALPAAAAAGRTAPTNLAQGYPSRPIRIVVPNTAGSGLDAVSRLVGRKLTEAWGQQVVIDNRAGAGGNIGTEIVAKLNFEQIKMLNTVEFREQLSSLGADPLGTTPAEYALHIRTQLEKMRQAIKMSGARPD